MPKASNPPQGLTDTWGRRNRKIEDKVCEACGNNYRPLRSASRFCSRPCMWSMNGKSQPRKEVGDWYTNARGYIERMEWRDGRRVTVKQHRFLMEQHVGRELLPTEDVHHINGDKTDNRIENLALVPHDEHTRITNSERTYRRGYKLELTNAERKARAERAKAMRLDEIGRAAIAKATGGTDASD